MTGSNCAIVGCNTTRKHKDRCQFRCPNPSIYPQWSKEFLSVVTRDRVVDKKFKTQIDKNNVYVCDLHFNEDDLWHYSHCTKMKEGVIPTRNLPVKSHSSKPAPRSTPVISKREQYIEQQIEFNNTSLPKPRYASYSEFVNRTTTLKLAAGWDLHDHTNYFEAKYFEPCSKLTTAKYQIFVDQNLQYTLRCYGWTISTSSDIHQLYPSFNMVTFCDFLLALDSYKICKGVNHVEFKQAIDLKHHIIPKLFDYPGALLPEADSVPLCQQEFLRAPTCKLLINSDKCPECEKMEIKVRSQLNQKRKILTSPIHPNAPLSIVSPDRLISTIQHLKRESKALHKENTILSERLKSALEKDSVPVDGEVNDALVDIFQGIPEDKVPPFMKLFWQEQQKYLHTKHKGQLRYHPAIIKYCLSIAAKSSSAYEQLRVDTKDGSGVLILPSQRTLRSYRNYIRPKQGFNPDIIEDLTERTKDFSDSERFVTILIDEMKIQEDLVWDKNTGQLIGFIDFGDDQINEALIEDREKLATHIMVFLVRSVKNPLSYSFANFATDGASSSQIFSLFWKCVGILEISCGLKVIATVADGASINRKFVQMNRDPDDTESIVYRVVNQFAETQRYIFFFADAPHLIKTARNCLWSSGSDFSSRLLWNSGDLLLWSHIKGLYIEDQEDGLHLLPKLTDDHIHLTSYSKMRVNLAAQVLSETVGKTLRDFGPKAAYSTAEFCLNFDKFFDCFNVRSTQQAKRDIKPFLEPYRKNNIADRFKFLDDFLGYLNDWKENVNERQGEFTAIQRNNMFLSLPTFNGIQMSINSLKKIIPYLLENDFEYVLSEKFCQDDLENYFGRQRAIGRRKDNPSAADTIRNDAIIKSQFDTKPIAGANCKSNIDKSIPDDTPLKKKKKLL